METKFGNTVIRFRTENDVWPIYFVHALAQGANLIGGGPSRRWRLTPEGEMFLTLPASAQLWALFAAWWYRVDWMIAYSSDIFIDRLPDQFTTKVASILRA
ncbi:MAG: hypothetical protein WCG34_00630 [Leptolinea sp.]